MDFYSFYGVGITMVDQYNVSGKLRLDSSAKHCALLSVFGSRSIVFVLLSPGRIPSELLVVSAAGGLSVRGVQKSSVTCQLQGN